MVVLDPRTGQLVTISTATLARIRDSVGRAPGNARERAPPSSCLTETESGLKRRKQEV